MHFVDMGSADSPAVLFLHGLMMDFERCYGDVALRVDGPMRPVLAVLDGHDAVHGGEFVSIAAECEQIEAWVREKLGGRLYGLCGLSLGGTIAVELLGRGNIAVERAVLDAPCVAQMGLRSLPCTQLMVMAAGRLSAGKGVPWPLMDAAMGRGNRSLEEMFYPGVSEATIRNACREIFSYRIPPGLRAHRRRTALWRGSREGYPAKGAWLLRQVLPDLEEMVFPKMGHCQLLHEHPGHYARELLAFMKG